MKCFRKKLQHSEESAGEKRVGPSAFVALYQKLIQMKNSQILLFIDEDCFIVCTLLLMETRI